MPRGRAQELKHMLGGHRSGTASQQWIQQLGEEAADSHRALAVYVCMCTSGQADRWEHDDVLGKDLLVLQSEQTQSVKKHAPCCSCQQRLDAQGLDGSTTLQQSRYTTALYYSTVRYSWYTTALHYSTVGTLLHYTTLHYTTVGTLNINETV